MKKNLCCTAAFLSVLFVFIFVGGCVEKKPPAESITERPEPLVSSEALKPADLEIVWTYNLPMAHGEGLKNFSILGDRLYTISGRNYLVSLDREKAQPAYSWQLARPGLTFCGLRQYDSRIYSIVGADLVSFDAQDGTMYLSKPLGFGPVCPPARNTSFFYVAGTDRRVHVMQADDMVQLFEVSANDDGDITCVTADDDMIAFATDAGTLAAMLPGKPLQLWRFEASGAINGPVAYDGRQFVFSSKDAYVYAVDRSKGELIWKFLTPALLTDEPKVTQRYVYQYVTGHGLLALDKATGALAWRLPEGIDLLAENGRSVYVIAEQSKLVLFDNKNLKKLCEVEIPGVTRWAANTADAGIYLADESGRIACIKPIKY